MSLLEDRLNEYICNHFKPDKTSSENDLRVYERIKENIEQRLSDSLEFRCLKSIRFDLLEYYDKSCCEQPYYKNLDKSFAEMLCYWLDNKNMQAPDLYKRANINKQTYSRIISEPDSPPKKSIALALAIALQLNLDETKDLIKRAGHALSDSIMTDVIVQFFIEKKIYDIDIINSEIIEKDGVLLGSRMH